MKRKERKKYCIYDYKKRDYMYACVRSRVKRKREFEKTRTE